MPAATRPPPLSDAQYRTVAAALALVPALVGGKLSAATAALASAAVAAAPAEAPASAPDSALSGMRKVEARAAAALAAFPSERSRLLFAEPSMTTLKLTSMGARRAAYAAADAAEEVQLHETLRRLGWRAEDVAGVVWREQHPEAAAEAAAGWGDEYEKSWDLHFNSGNPLPTPLTRNTRLLLPLLAPVPARRLLPEGLQQQEPAPSSVFGPLRQLYVPMARSKRPRERVATSSASLLNCLRAVPESPGSAMVSAASCSTRCCGLRPPRVARISCCCTGL